MPVVKPFGCPHAASSCFALARSPDGCVVASYRSKCWYPMTSGGSTVLAIAPPPTGPPYAAWRSVLFAAYSTALRQDALLSGTTLVLRYAKYVAPIVGSSASFFSAGPDRIFDRALACT